MWYFNFYFPFCFSFRKVHKPINFNWRNPFITLHTVISRWPVWYCSYWFGEIGTIVSQGYYLTVGLWHHNIVASWIPWILAKWQGCHVEFVGRGGLWISLHVMDATKGFTDVAYQVAQMICWQNGDPIRVFFCSKCCFFEVEYDSAAALHIIAKGVTRPNYLEQVMNEKRLRLQTYHTLPGVQQNLDQIPGTHDPTATGIIVLSKSRLQESYLPLNVFEDGNYLFCAISSRAVYRTEIHYIIFPTAAWLHWRCMKIVVTMTQRRSMINLTPLWLCCCHI